MEYKRIPWEFLSEYRGKEFTGEWPTFPELLKIQTGRWGERPFLTDFEGPDGAKNTLTYSQAYEKIMNTAKWLIKNGLKKGDKVIVTGKNVPEWVIVYLATLCASGIIIPLDNGLNEKEAENLTRVADPKFIFSDEEKYLFFKKNFPKLNIKALNPKHNDDYVYNLEVSDDVKMNEPVSENDTAAILFTSGTTGNPKGVMLSHKNLISDGYIAQLNLWIMETDVFYALLPIHHAYTMQAAFICPLEVGAEIVFGKSMAVSRLMRELKEGGITILLGVPLLFNKLMAGIQKGIAAKGAVVKAVMGILEGISFFVKTVFGKNIGKTLFSAVLKQANIYTLRVAICGGGPLAPSVFKKYNAMGINFIQGYGLTEKSQIIALNPVEHFKIESVGSDFYPYAEIKIISEDNSKIGEIVVKGPMVMQGYYNMPEETAAMFTEDGYLKTGDLGWMDKERYIMLCGRAKNLIVTAGGKNVYPEEIEDAFQLCTDIQQIVIQGYSESEAEGEMIEALVYPSDDLYARLQTERAPMVVDEVKEIIQVEVNKVNKTLQPYARITRLTILDKPLDMTTTQKVKRNYKK